MMEHIILEGSSYAHQVDHLIDLIFYIVAFWFLLAEGILFYFVIAYRRKKSPKAEYITGEKLKHTKFIHWAHYAVVFCDLFILYFAVTAWYHVKQELPQADRTIRIVGQQWAWKFTDPGLDNQLDTDDDIITMDELHLEVGQVYHFKLEAKDVIHSFSVPIFRLKQDAIPGRVITGWFMPTQTGEFDIQCTQMCGIGHGTMGAKLVVETKEQHRQWLLEQSGKAPAPAAAVTQKPENMISKK